MHRRTSLVLLNGLSLSRLPLAGVFVSTQDPLARVGLVVGAAATDFLDGWIARHRHLESYWGALIDPLADRGFVMVALAAFVAEGKLTPVEFGTLVVRDVATGVGFVVARFLPMKFQARMLGKVVTTLQLGALMSVLVAPKLVRPLVAAVGVTALAAVVDYTLTVWRKRAHPGEGEARPVTRATV
jgi:phosphatidylglycerophosphate synthase